MERASRSLNVWTPLLPSISDRNRNKSKISEFVIGLRRTARRSARNSGRTAHIGTCSFVSLLQVQTKRSVQHRRPGTALLSARGRHRSSGRQRGRGHLIPARLHRKTGQFADSGLPSPQSAKRTFSTQSAKSCRSRNVRVGCVLCKGGAFQRVQIPSGNRSNRKQSSSHGGNEVAEALISVSQIGGSQGFCCPDSDADRRCA